MKTSERIMAMLRDKARRPVVSKRDARLYYKALTHYTGNVASASIKAR